MQHPDEGELHAWLDGQLDAARVAELEAHVAACPSCADAVAEARGLIAASTRILSALDVVPGGVLPGEPERVQPPAAARRPWNIPLRAAAVLMVAVIGAVTWTRIRPDRVALQAGSEATTVAADRAMVQEAPESSAPAANAPSAPALVPAPQSLPARTGGATASRGDDLHSRRAAAREADAPAAARAATGAGPATESAQFSATDRAVSREARQDTAEKEVPRAVLAPVPAPAPAVTAAAPPVAAASERRATDTRDAMERRRMVPNALAQEPLTAAMPGGSRNVTLAVAGCYVTPADSTRSIHLELQPGPAGRDSLVALVRSGPVRQRGSWTFGEGVVRLVPSRTPLGEIREAQVRGDTLVAGALRLVRWDASICR
jgi:hypothetical protein